MNIIEVINSNDGAIVGKGATEKDIIDAEKELGLTFSKEYRDYLQAFGSALVDSHFLTGISKAAQMNVVFVTQRERKFIEDIPNNFYVIENTGLDGIVIWQDENGIIYSSSDNGVKEICDSLVEYLNKYSA